MPLPPPLFWLELLLGLVKFAASFLSRSFFLFLLSLSLFFFFFFLLCNLQILCHLPSFFFLSLPFFLSGAKLAASPLALLQLLLSVEELELLDLELDLLVVL